MYNISEIIQAVLATDMLAPTPAALAAALGYKGRSAKDNLLDGSAKKMAIGNFLARLEETYCINEEELCEIYVTINNVKYLGRVLKGELNFRHKDTAWRVVESFVEGEYGLFTNEFNEYQLPAFLKLKDELPTVFYRTLAYFYFKHCHGHFYGRGSHNERCAVVMKELGARLAKLYPYNTTGVRIAAIYDGIRLGGFEAPIQWSCVKNAAALIEAYADPNYFMNQMSKTRILPGTNDRTYWNIDDDRKVILTVTYEGRHDWCGFYVAFTADKETGTLTQLGQVSLVGDDTVEFCPDFTSNRLGSYLWDGEMLRFIWEDDSQVPEELRRGWRKINMKESESVRRLDSLITDDAISVNIDESVGVEEVPNMVVTDVMVGRREYVLTLNNRRQYAILRNDPFLEKLTPDDIVVISRDKKSGEIMVVWFEYSYALPLSLFREIP